jgi:hypothetical protein
VRQPGERTGWIRTGKTDRDEGSRDEDGQVMILILGYTVLSLLVVTVVMAVSAVYIEHKKLLSVADGASLAAADAFGLGEVAAAGAAPVAILDRDSVQGSVQRYLDATGAHSRFSQLGISGETGTPDSRTAHVVLTAVVHPPVVNLLVPAGIPIIAVSDARSELTR